MPAFMDASCPKCGRRIGWHGRCVDRPTCPKCGHRPPDAELADADAKMDEFRRLLAMRPNASVCYEQRVAAGLTLRQAAKKMGIFPSDLSDFEHGREPLPDDVAAMMAEIYARGEPT